MARFRTGTGAPAVILRAWVNEEFELLISDHILDEVIRTLSKPYFRQRVSPDVCRDTLEAFVGQAAFISVTDVISGIATHQKMTGYCRRWHRYLLTIWLPATGNSSVLRCFGEAGLSLRICFAPFWRSEVQRAGAKRTSACREYTREAFMNLRVCIPWPYLEFSSYWLAVARARRIWSAWSCAWIAYVSSQSVTE